ncbi:signal transduction histidine-protein kinase/phosphatase UhpB [Vibrio atypicus]|uniref:signal transduction histidine-protein kinase/phosphatase UhpB n=1 Tax=Vibrio atypicus TaxID=558271 RepID=UPI003736B784
MQKKITLFICLWSFMLCCLFCLWMLSHSIIEDITLAALLFPFGFRTGVLLHSRKKHWCSIYSAELTLIIGMSFVFKSYDFSFLFIASILSVLIISLAQPSYQGSQWKHLYIIGILIFLTSFINALSYSIYNDDVFFPLLCSICGSLILIPSCYLAWSYFFKNHWFPLTAELVEKPVNLRNQHILMFLFLFLLSIFTQTGIPSNLHYFAPFCLALPIIILAYRYGWQGALLATFFNSVAVIATQVNTELSVTDLLLSLSTQTLTGVLLGVGVQRQRELNQQLIYELDRNKKLTKQLLETEEGVRKDIARELHDEIGQNITAIRIKSNLIQRVDNKKERIDHASRIESLSVNIYDTTSALLNRLRPKTLDDLGLKDAICQTIDELEFKSQKIKVFTFFKIDEKELNDSVKIILYRTCQETLNNIVKYADASEVSILILTKTLKEKSHYYLSISDNGVGFEPHRVKRGLGLKGINERVLALGGIFKLSSNKSSSSNRTGTTLTVILPEI